MDRGEVDGDAAEEATEVNRIKVQIQYRMERQAMLNGRQHIVQEAQQTRAEVIRSRS